MRPGLDIARKLGVFGPAVVESMDRSASYAEGFAGANVERPPVHRPSRGALEPVDRLLERVVTVRRRHLVGGNVYSKTLALPFESAASTRKRTLRAPS